MEVIVISDATELIENSESLGTSYIQLIDTVVITTAQASEQYIHK